MSAEKNKKNCFVEGAVSPFFVTEQIEKHSTKTTIGAHSIFLGQVRADVIDDKKVAAIEYTCYKEMALEKMEILRNAVCEKYPLICLHVYHSLGIVKAGKISLFVFASSQHRRAAVNACSEIVDLIKNELPVWGKEIFENETYQWKVNT